MRIYTRIRIDVDTGETLESESFEYSGPVAECKGGGGGGGTGMVSWPAYLEQAHSEWLDGVSTQSPEKSVLQLMNEAIGASPFSGEIAYDPDADIAFFVAQLVEFEAAVDLLSAGTGLDDLVSGVLDESRIDDAVDEYAADYDAQLAADVYPTFEAGMRDINAVVSSAFVIGRANIVESRNREVGKFSSALHLKAFGDDAIKVIGMKLEYEKTVAHLTAEMYRIKITAKKEEADRQLEIDESDARWDLETYQYGANVMAAVGGGTAQPGLNPRGQKPSAIGGALSGAATGAMVGGMIPGVGAGIGALAGGIIGLGASLLS